MALGLQLSGLVDGGQVVLVAAEVDVAVGPLILDQLLQGVGGGVIVPLVVIAVDLQADIGMLLAGGSRC